MKSFSPDNRPEMKNVLMVSPEHFRVEYAINVYMKTQSGELQKINNEMAQTQWDALKRTYEKIGYQVSVIKGEAKFPDMVFAANQSFVFWDSAFKKPAVLMSQMRSDFRKPEVGFFRQWFKKNDYAVFELHDKELSFEGNGDALLHPGLKLIWGGWGTRTDRGVYGEIKERFGFDVIPLTLQTKEFYHLDTCFSILNQSTVAIQPQAFDDESKKVIYEVFDRVIEIDFDENIKFFSGNCHSPNGRDVILQSGSSKFSRDLEKAGFQLHLVDTSEFMKSGGSCFCLKMMCY